LTELEELRFDAGQLKYELQCVERTITVLRKLGAVDDIGLADLVEARAALEADLAKVLQRIAEIEAAK